MTVASFVAAQRADHGIPHVLCCRALGVSPSWFYKWRDRSPTPRQERRERIDEAVRRSFEESGATYGSPRVHADLVEAGWAVSERTVAASMAAQGVVGAPSGGPSPDPTRQRSRHLKVIWLRWTSSALTMVMGPPQAPCRIFIVGYHA